MTAAADRLRVTTIRGIVDLVRDAGCHLDRRKRWGRSTTHIDIPAETRRDQAQAEYHAKLVEVAVVEMDDAAMEAYLEGREDRRSPDDFASPASARGTTGQQVRRGSCAGRLSRTRACSRCSTAVVDFPAGAYGRRIHPRCQGGERRRRSSARSSDDEPFAALAFKIMNDPFVGTLTFIRVYSGVIETEQPALSATPPRAGASASAGCC